MVPTQSREGTMSTSPEKDKVNPAQRAPLPIAAPARREKPEPGPGEPDLRIEEIEERHIPKDRNIFDK